MAEIGSINSSLVQSQLNAGQLGEKIAYAVAAKSLNVARDQGAAILSLLDQAVNLAENAGPQPASSPLGQNLDLQA